MNRFVCKEERIPLYMHAAERKRLGISIPSKKERRRAAIRAKRIV